MDPMPETPEAVVEFGPDDAAVRAARRRFSVGGFAAGLADDRRLVPLAAVLGGVALFGSLVSEWQITVVDGAFWGDGEVGTRSLQTTVADLGGWGGGYLTGLFLLVAAATITLFGPPPGRRYARLVALSVGGVLLGMLAALGSYLGDTSGILGEFGASGLEEEQISMSHGRGIWCAAAGVALVMLAMYLAGRRSTPAPDESPVEEPAPVWSWRRPREAAEDDGPPEAPFGLTVTSVKPFTASSDNRDKPG
jgi:hypothetical protein